MFLTAGGWPAARDFENPDAIFYYDLDTSLFAPDFVWFAGENGWDEALRIVREVGGQLYQRSDGVLVYRQPLNFGEQAATWTLTDQGTPGATTQLYPAPLGYRRSDRKAVTEVRCAFVGRRKYDLQEVHKDTQPRYIAAGETLPDIVFQLDRPLKSIETASGLLDIVPGATLTTTLKTEALAIYDGTSRASTGYTQSITVAAQRISISITNTSGGPLEIDSITLRGEPIGPASTGVATAGTAGETMNIDDPAYVQRASHAEALCNLYLDFYQVARPTYSIQDMLYNPALDIGQAVYLTNLRLGLTNERCIIINKAHDRTGHTMSVDLVPVDDLPTLSEYYLVGGSYSGQTKRLGY